MATVSLPGGGKVYNLSVGSDASAALKDAIKSEFTAAGKNFTMNVVASGKAGKAGFFNGVISDATKITAGTGVQAIFAQGTGKETLTGGKSTTLIYANGASKVGDSISVVANTSKTTTSVFGTDGADTLKVTTGNVTAYLEGGANKVTLAGTADTLSLGGTGNASVTVSGAAKATISGGSGNVSIAGGTGTLNFTNQGGDDTVNVKNKIGGDTLTGGLTTKGTDVFNITLGTSGKYVISSFGSGDKITGLTAAQLKTALASEKTSGSGTKITSTFTVGKDTITVTGVAITKTNFT